MQISLKEPDNKDKFFGYLLIFADITVNVIELIEAGISTATTPTLFSVFPLQNATTMMVLGKPHRSAR